MQLSYKLIPKRQFFYLEYVLVSEAWMHIAIYVEENFGLMI